MATRAAHLGFVLRDGLLALQDKYEVVGDVRGRGLLQGIELVLDRETKQSSDELGAGITRRCLELGLHMNIVQMPGAGSVFRIAPALTSSEEELALGLGILDQAMGEAVA
jgi:2,2-dialkylglycine decarboxylase (pyruvate)